MNIFYLLLIALLWEALVICGFTLSIRRSLLFLTFSKCFLAFILCLLFFMDLNKVFPLLSLTPFLFKAEFDVLSFFCPFIWYSRWVDFSEHSIFLHCPPLMLFFFFFMLKTDIYFLWFLRAFSRLLLLFCVHRFSSYLSSFCFILL